MGRDLQKCHDFAASWYGGSLSCVASKVAEHHSLLFGRFYKLLNVAAVFCPFLAYRLLEHR